MDVARVRDQLRAFVQRHRVVLEDLTNRESQLLELAGLVIAAEHYRRSGYIISPQNIHDRVFRIKATSRGYPWNFSWFRLQRQRGRVQDEYELYQNLGVQSENAVEAGVYVVDVAIVQAGSVTPTRRGADWAGTRNRDLSTFMEVKRLVVYPMLLAHFVGIVHEILPTYLSGMPRGHRAASHFVPTLLSLGYLKATAANIRDGYAARGFHIGVLVNADRELAELRFDDDARSPLPTR